MKKIPIPLIILLISLVLVVALVLTLLLVDFGGGQEETYRNAKVIAVKGTATLLRGEEAMGVYEGMALQGGDQITTASGGRVDLKLDEDKYVVMEENTIVSFLLQGDPQKGAIRLHQTAGTVHHTIENPLAEEDSYEVHTPDAVMAVRGTEFSTSVTQTENGSQTTTEVQEGNVEMTPNNQEEAPKNLGPGESATAESSGDGPAHFWPDCPGCNQTVETLEAHLLSCGEGHYSCDGKDHDTLSCGNTACVEGHGAMECGHCICDDQYESHNQMPCGHYTCNMEDLGHYLLPCGNYDCKGNGHVCCYGCGGCFCTGDHSEYPCGHLVCVGGTHDARPCGHFTCDEGDHEHLECGHYACDGLIHDAYHNCGNLLCAEGHEGCVYCGQCMCTGEHGDGICNVFE